MKKILTIIPLLTLLLSITSCETLSGSSIASDKLKKDIVNTIMVDAESKGYNLNPIVFRHHPSTKKGGIIYEIWTMKQMWSSNTVDYEVSMEPVPTGGVTFTVQEVTLR